MADPRFFTVAGPFTAAELARRTGASLDGRRRDRLEGRGAARCRRARSFELPRQPQIPRCLAQDARRRLSSSIPIWPSEAPKNTALLVTPEPYRAYALAAQAFYPEARPEPGIDPKASIDKSAKLGSGCRVEAGAVIGRRAELGAHCHIGPNAVIGEACVLGDEVRVGANASLSHCLIGHRVRIYPGARIGQDGFGFAPDRKGFIKVPQLGRVVIGDDVEIGANTTIDRGAGPDTVIGPGTMIDNLVQIGHNVQIGRQCVLVALVGISGSTRLGDFVMIGGQAGFAGHLTIGSGARIGAQAGVMRDIEPGETVVGAPAIPVKEFFRQTAALARLAKNGTNRASRAGDGRDRPENHAGGDGSRADHADDPASLSVPDDRQGDRCPRRRKRHRRQKRDAQTNTISKGHFPQRPVMPGVLIIEAMAQTAAVLVVHTLGPASEGKLVYFMSVDNARFRRPVFPATTACMSTSSASATAAMSGNSTARPRSTASLWPKRPSPP